MTTGLRAFYSCSRELGCVRAPCSRPRNVLVACASPLGWLVWDGAVWYGERHLGEICNFRDIFLNKIIRDGEILSISVVSEFILNLPALVFAYDF